MSYWLISALLLPRRLLRDMRTRLTLIPGLIIIVVVAAAMYLTARHATDLVRRETQLVMSNLAVTALNSVASQPLAPPVVHERFLQTMINAKPDDEIFSVDIVFALVQDSHGVVTAMAANEPALAHARYPLSGDRASKLAALSALASDPALATRHRLILVQASLERDQPSLTVTLGCRRKPANYLISQIIARHVAVGVLIVLTALVSLWVALGHATRPIRQVFQAVSHVSRGRLGYPVLARERDEVGRVAQSVEEIRVSLARGRQWQELALERLCASEIPLAHLPREAVYLVLPLDARVALPELVERVLAQDGTVEGVSEGYLFASWGREGAEQDDLLRAVVAGLEMAQDAESLWEAPCWPLVCLRPELAVLADLPAPGAEPAAAVWLDADAREALAPVLAAGDFTPVGEIIGVWQALTWGPL